MRFRTFHVGIFLVTLLAVNLGKRGFASGKPNGDLDQLLSFTYAFNRKVRPAIEAKLVQTPASHGRMIRIPSFPEVGESAVSVDCSTVGAKNGSCRVTLTRAQLSMENTFVEHLGEANAVQKVIEIPVVRKDADIPRASAIAFRDCLRVMIPRPGDPLELHSVTRTHSERIEFWLEEPNMPIRKGERAEYPGQRTKTLIRMGDLLTRYVEAASSERAAVAKQIENEASRILAARGNKPKTKK